MHYFILVYNVLSCTWLSYDMNQSLSVAVPCFTFWSVHLPCYRRYLMYQCICKGKYLKFHMEIIVTWINVIAI